MAKTAAEVAQKWANRAQGASGDYSDGVRTTDKDQAARAIAAKANYQQALQESFGRDAYAKGLQKAGSQKWREKSVSLGGQRYGGGVADAVDDYTQGSARFDGARRAADTLPRGVKGSPQNLQRVSAVVTALRKVKTGT